MLRRGSEGGEVLLILPRHHRVLRVVGLGGREQSLDRFISGLCDNSEHNHFKNTDLDTKKNCPERHSRRPLVLQDVQADGARHARDVGVPDLGDEANLRHGHDIVTLLSRIVMM